MVLQMQTTFKAYHMTENYYLINDFFGVRQVRRVKLICPDSQAARNFLNYGQSRQATQDPLSEWRWSPAQAIIIVSVTYSGRPGFP